MKTIFITGGNKGIGYALVKALSQQTYNIIIGCRSQQRALQAIAKLKPTTKADLNFVLVDMSLSSSIKECVKVLTNNYPPIDILVNNAGIIDQKQQFNHEYGEMLMRTNVLGLMELTQNLKVREAIINVSSKIGKLSFNVKSHDLADKLTKIDNLIDLSAEVNRYLKLIQLKQLMQAGYHSYDTFSHSQYLIYAASKMFLNIYTKILGHAKLKEGVAVWGMSPGYTATDMTKHKGTKTPEEGIDTILFLLNERFKSSTQGLYYANRQIQPVFEF